MSLGSSIKDVVQLEGWVSKHEVWQQMEAKSANHDSYFFQSMNSQECLNHSKQVFLPKNSDWLKIKNSWNYVVRSSFAFIFFRLQISLCKWWNNPQKLGLWWKSRLPRLFRRNWLWPKQQSTLNCNNPKSHNFNFNTEVIKKNYLSFHKI